MNCSTTPSPYFATLPQKECAAHSLVKALDTFLTEVQEMRDVIMVPNRLRGVPLPKINRSVNDRKNGMAVVAVGSRAVVPYDPNGFALVNGARRLMEESEKTKEGLAWPEDLYRRYRVVQALRRELIRDRCNRIEDDENDDEQTRILAAHFRQHLNGLFEVLDQLTGMAKHLSEWYQDEVNNNGKR